jgi:CheY-like chemotaxis protein/two-component sensor histidine kinase
MELYLDTFDVARMVEEVRATVLPLVHKNGNTLSVQCPVDIGCIRADETKLRQTLLNLLSNASKFTEGGRIELAASREGEWQAQWFTFRVTDTGIGMSADQVTRLFQPFTQADASTTRRYGGTGLGLTISRRFCQMMGGDIVVASEQGHGSTFTVRIPAAPLGLTETDLSAGGSLPAESNAPTVLVIDDDPSVRDLLNRFLTKEGFRVALAAGGEDGLRQARAFKPAAITLDVMMPGMDGWAVLSALKGDSGLVDVPVIMLTIVDERNVGYTLGASDYLLKPIDRDRLLAVLRRHATPAYSVLVVDDDPAARRLTRGILEREGWRVAEAENGMAALEALSQDRPDIILLDLGMPVMDGFAFVEELRRRPDVRGIPIVVMTARDVTEDVRRRLNGGVERYLQKASSTRDDLLRTLREILPGR